MNSTNDTASVSLGQQVLWFFDPGWNWFTWNIFVWLFPIICLQGAIANACSFYVIVSNRKSFPYVTRQYLTIITISDFLILTLKASTHYFGYMAFYVKENSWTWFTVPRDWGFAWCIAYDFVTYYAPVGAPFFQLGLTVDRLIAVAAPLKAKMILTHKRSWILLAVITAMALVLPIMFVSNRMWDYSKGKCGIRLPTFYDTVYLPTEMYFGRVFLFSALILGTIAICFLLASSNRAAQRMQVETASANQQQQQSSRERQRSLIRISLMLVFINVILLISSLPWSVSAIAAEVLLKIMNQNSYVIMMRHFNSLMYLTNALSWPVYFMGRNFREAFNRIFVPPCLRPAARGSGATQQSYRYKSETATTTAAG